MNPSILAGPLLLHLFVGLPRSTDSQSSVLPVLAQFESHDSDRANSDLILDPANSYVRCEKHNAAIAYAVELRNSGQGEAALACLQQAAELQKTDSVLWTDVGIQADALKRFELAHQALTRARQLDPGSVEALYGLARVETDRGRLAEAEGLLHEYLQLKPQDATAHYGLGSVLQRQQRDAEATLEFKRSIELLPAQTESYYQLGQIALNAHRDEEARSYFARTLARMPTHGGALSGTGILAYRAHNYADARRSLEAAIAASPAYQPAHYYLGLTLARLGEPAASAAELDRAAALATEQQSHSAPVGRAN